MKSIPHAPPEPNAFAAGAEACKKGKDVHTSNPYVKGSRPYIRWINGYQAAQRDALERRPLPDWVTAQEEIK